MTLDSITRYLDDGIVRLMKSVLLESDCDASEKRFLRRQAAVQMKKQRIRKQQNVHVPVFLIASITERCNLHCSGCYARGCGFCTDTPTEEEPLTVSEWMQVFRDADELGVSFVLLTGGEPMTDRELLKAASSIEQMIFPVFTNGTLFDDDMFRLFSASRNLFPVFSLEGGRDRTDLRRGCGIFDTVSGTCLTMKNRRLLFGISITVTSENIDEVTSAVYLEQLAEMGACVVFLIEYTATGTDDTYLELSGEDRDRMADRLSYARRKIRSVWFLAFPGDEDFMGGCLAAGRGFIHINPFGDAQPCPFAPYSDTSLKTSRLSDAVSSPLFARLKTEGYLSEIHDGGCALAHKGKELENLLR